MSNVIIKLLLRTMNIMKHQPVMSELCSNKTSQKKTRIPQQFLSYALRSAVIFSSLDTLIINIVMLNKIGHEVILFILIMYNVYIEGHPRLKRI